MRILLVTSIVLLTFIYGNSQCYNQYGYDVSGNRTNRTYIGGCGKPAPGIDGEHAQLMTQSDPTVIGELGISQTTEVDATKYHLYPNPTYGLINLDVSIPTLKGMKYANV